MVNKKTKEFNLSEEVIDDDYDNKIYLEKNVKESVKILKGKIREYRFSFEDEKNINDFIKETFGDRLI